MTDDDVMEYFTNRAGALVQEPGENDVVVLLNNNNNNNNNKKPAHHKGNQRLWDDADAFRERYKGATSLAEKKELAHQLLVRVKDRSGLFLKYNNNNNTTTADEGRWCIQNYEEASLRVRQILREATGKPIKSLIGNSNGKSTTAALTAPTSALTPRMPRGNHAHHTAEYLEACQVLSDATMNQACELLLKNHTSDGNTATTPDAQEQLLQIYQKCVQAAHVLETELNNNPNPTSAFPMPPTLRGGRIASMGVAHATATASGAMISKTKNVIPAVNRTRMKHPSEFPQRGSMGLGSTGNNNHGSISHGGVKGSELPPSKKVRRAPSPPPAATAAPSSSAVPESALQFLAKLNKDQETNNNSHDAGEKKKKKKNEEVAEGDSQSSKNSDDLEPSIETTQEPSAPPVRVQPSRSSKTS